MSLDQFFDDTDPYVPSVWGTEVEKERRNRIKLSVAAYTYEVYDDPIMSDAELLEEKKPKLRSPQSNPAVPEPSNFKPETPASKPADKPAKKK